MDVVVTAHSLEHRRVQTLSSSFPTPLRISVKWKKNEDASVAVAKIRRQDAQRRTRRQFSSKKREPSRLAPPTPTLPAPAGSRPSLLLASYNRWSLRDTTWTRRTCCCRSGMERQASRDHLWNHKNLYFLLLKAKLVLNGA